MFQADTSNGDRPLAAPLARPDTAGGVSRSSNQPQELARAAPTPAELERSAAAIVCGDDSTQCAILLGVPATFGLLVSIKQATESALACAPLQEEQQPQAAATNPASTRPLSVTQARARLLDQMWQACVCGCH